MMFETSQFLLFSLATLLVVIAPGPGMLFVISRGIGRGRRAGVIAAAGTSTGIALHILGAALGFSLIVYATDIGFHLTKWAGGIYLLILAWKAFTHRQTLKANSVEITDGRTSIFWQGMLVNALNPKVAIFFISFIPQFVKPEMGSVTAQTVVLGTIFMVLTVIIFLAYGIFSGMIGKWVIEQPRVNKLIDWATGSLFVLLGIRLALASR